jgi:hypothetical protein
MIIIITIIIVIIILYHTYSEILYRVSRCCKVPVCRVHSKGVCDGQGASEESLTLHEQRKQQRRVTIERSNNANNAIIKIIKLKKQHSRRPPRVSR